MNNIFKRRGRKGYKRVKRSAVRMIFDLARESLRFSNYPRLLKRYSRWAHEQDLEANKDYFWRDNDR